MTTRAPSTQPVTRLGPPPRPGGALWMLLGEGLVVPTGLVTVAYLTRRLGPDGYGLFTLAATLVLWIEFAISSFFSRATIHFVGSSGDPSAVAATAYRLRLAVDCAAAALLFAAAPAAAGFFGEPDMASLLRIFAVDIPLFGRARIQREVLIGRGRHRRAGLGLCGRWIVRVTLIVVLVESGLSIRGAVLGSLGASVAEALINHTRSSVRGAARRSFPIRPMLGYAIPLFITSVLILVFNRLDLVLLKALGTTTALVGAFAASQNAALTIGILGTAISPVVLSNLSRLRASGDAASARTALRAGLRAITIAAPLVALVSATAGELVPVLFGPGFEAGVPVLSILAVAAFGQCLWGVLSGALTAAGRPRLVLALTIPIPVLAAVGHLLAIPRFGLVGAATVSLAVIWLGTAAMLPATAREWHAWPDPRSVARSAGVAVVVAAAAWLWPTPGLWVAAKLVLLSVAALGLLVALSELGLDEMRMLAEGFLRPYGRDAGPPAGGDGEARQAR